MRRPLPFLLVVALGGGSLLFDLTLGARLPSDADWAEAAAFVRTRPAPVQVWPPWAERARMFPGGPLFFEEDLAFADYQGIERLWLLSLPRVPFARISRAEGALRRRGATAVGDPQPFGALRLQLYDLHAPPFGTDLLHPAEEHEVDYVPRRCLEVPIGARASGRGEGRTLHVRAGIIGERAYDPDRPEVTVEVFADGVTLGALPVPPTTRDGAGWRKLDLPLAPGPKAFLFAVTSPDVQRPFCLAAWTTL